MSTNDDSTAGIFRIGGELAVDFVNTVPVIAGAAVDQIATPAGLLAWYAGAGLLGRDQVDRLAGEADASGHVELLALREDLRALFQARVDAVPADPSRLARLNAALRIGASHGAGGHDTLDLDGAAYRLIHRPATPTWGSLAYPIARSAAELLASDRLRYLRRCENPACVLFFVDLSKNHARRWCSMAACGNRHKVAAHHRRKRRGA